MIQLLANRRTRQPRQQSEPGMSMSKSQAGYHMIYSTHISHKSFLLFSYFLQSVVTKKLRMTASGTNFPIPNVKV